MKNLLNAQYGMMTQCPVKYDIKYINSRDGLFSEDMTADEEELLKKYYKRACFRTDTSYNVTRYASEFTETVEGVASFYTILSLHPTLFHLFT